MNSYNNHSQDNKSKLQHTKAGAKALQKLVHRMTASIGGAFVLLSGCGCLLVVLILALVVTLSLLAMFAVSMIVSTQSEYLVSGKFPSAYSPTGQAWAGDFVIGNTDLSMLPGDTRQHAQLIWLVEKAVESQGLNISKGDLRNLQILALGVNGVESSGDLGDGDITKDYIDVERNGNGSGAIGPFQIVTKGTAWLAGWSEFPLPQPIPDWSDSSGHWSHSELFDTNNQTSPFWAPSWVYRLVQKAQISTAAGQADVKSALQAGGFTLSQEKINQIAMFVNFTHTYHGAASQTTKYTSYFLAELCHQYGDLNALSAVEDYVANGGSPHSQLRYAISPYGGTEAKAVFPSTLLRLNGKAIDKHLVDIIGDKRVATSTQFSMTGVTGDWYTVVKNSTLGVGGNKALNPSYTLMTWMHGKAYYDSIVNYMPKDAGGAAGANAVTGQGVVGGVNTTGKNNYVYPLDDFPGKISSMRGSRGGSMHQGVDFPKPEGTPIYAVAAGTATRVVTSPDGDGGGIRIKINHGSFSTYSMHMVRVADKFAGVGSTQNANISVQAGEVIGYVGNTGVSFGNHLHLEYIGSNGMYDNALTRLFNFTRLEVVNIARSYQGLSQYSTLPANVEANFDKLSPPW